MKILSGLSMGRACRPSFLVLAEGDIAYNALCEPTNILQLVLLELKRMARKLRPLSP